LKVVASVAIPEELTLTELIVVPPSVKRTDPNTVPAVGNLGCTVAVNVTCWARAEGLAEDTKESEFAPWFTNTETWLLPVSLENRSRAEVCVNEPVASAKAKLGMARDFAAANVPSPLLRNTR